MRVKGGTRNIDQCKLALEACVTRLDQLDPATILSVHATTIMWAAAKINANLGPKVTCTLLDKIIVSIDSMRPEAGVNTLFAAAQLRRLHGPFTDGQTALRIVGALGRHIADNARVLEASRVCEMFWAAYTLIGDAVFEDPPSSDSESEARQYHQGVVKFRMALIERAVEVHRDMVDFDVHEMLLVGCSLKPLWKDETKRRYGATLMNLLLKQHLL